MTARFPRCVVLVALLAAGCNSTDEPVTSYDVPKPAEYKAPPPPTDYRILGAMFPADNPTWFFKFQGKAEQVAKYEADIDRLLATVRVPPDSPEFQTPADWKRLGPRRVTRDGVSLQIDETLQFGPPDAPLELTITRSAGSVLDNVGRWAGQVGLTPKPKADDLPKYTREFDSAGGKGVRVDIPGPAGQRILGAMFPADSPTWFFKLQGKAEQVAKYEAEVDALLATVRVPPDSPEFETPAGWKRLGPRSVRRDGVRLEIDETVQFGPEDDPLELTVMRSGGSVLENVGRWAGQVGRPQPKPEDLPKYTRVIDAVGVRGLRVDVAGPKNPSAPRGPMKGRGN